MFPVVLLFISWCAGALTQSPQFYDLENAHIYFNEFVTKFGKTYASEHERRHRFDIFKANLEEVNKLNKEENITVFGINYFSDLTQEEFIKTFTGLRDADDDTHCEVQTENYILDNNVPDSFDWRNKHAVTRVKSQAFCGSCWAYSATGVLEGQYAIRHGELIELSEQQLVDCDYRSDGCCGGYPGSAIKSVIAEGGIMTEHDYPIIEEGNRAHCNVDKNRTVASVKRCISWNITSQEKLKRLLYTYGPISIAVRSAGLHKYKNGIVTERTCRAATQYKVDHAVLLVGYGTENGIPFWTVKNSYTEHWGESGYFRMVRGEGKDSCGMQNYFMTTAELA